MGRVAPAQLVNSGEPEPGFLAMWGSAAWAQTQLTPGVSTLAAPRLSIEQLSRVSSLQRQRMVTS